MERLSLALPLLSSCLPHKGIVNYFVYCLHVCTVRRNQARAPAKRHPGPPRFVHAQVSYVARENVVCFARSLAIGASILGFGCALCDSVLHYSPFSAAPPRVMFHRSLVRRCHFDGWMVVFSTREGLSLTGNTQLRTSIRNSRFYRACSRNVVGVFVSVAANARSSPLLPYKALIVPILRLSVCKKRLGWTLPSLSAIVLSRVHCGFFCYAQDARRIYYYTPPTSRVKQMLT